MKKPQQEENRTSCRANPRKILMASFRRGDENPNYGVVKDISGSGVRLRTDATFARNDGVHLAIPMNMDRVRVFIKPEARVVWRHPDTVKHGSGDPCDVGLCFTRIDESHRRLLIRVLENRELWSTPYRSTKMHGSSVFRPQVAGNSSAREVLVVAVGVEHIERISAAVDMIGLAPVVVGSVDAMCVRAASNPPSLVILSESLGARHFSDALLHIRRSCSDAIPVVSVMNSEGNPWTRPINYPVNATLDLKLDVAAVAKTVGLVTAPDKIGGTPRIGETRAAPALEGDLLDDDLCSVLQFLFTARKQGRLTVHISKRTGQIFIDSGIVTHCKFGYSSGRDAFIDCVSSRPPGYFLFETGLEPAVVRMHESGLELLLEASRKRDHRSRVVRVETSNSIWLAEGY